MVQDVKLECGSELMKSPNRWNEEISMSTAVGGKVVAAAAADNDDDDALTLAPPAASQLCWMFTGAVRLLSCKQWLRRFLPCEFVLNKHTIVVSSSGR